jgi:molecular chaperone DnaK (HSP70)
MEKVFGIDLGTTYSCIAYVDEAVKPVVVHNSENDRTTPSVVFFDENNEIIVGKEAKNRLNTDWDKVVSFIKRDMGNSGFLFNYSGEEYKPERISSFILKKLVKDASENVGFEIKDVVITCPAYFGIDERKATEIAGDLAGLNVKAIINEPTAAAIAYGMDKVENQTVLVYDLGGGTFDVTMIKVQPEKIEVVVTGGDHNLGGKNWDDALINYFASCFKDETGVQDDIISDKETFGNLQLIAEDAKKTLSTREKTTSAVIYGTEKARIETTREKFDEITSQLAELTISLTRQMLEEAKEKKGVTSFDKILLVGGSTRMPQIKVILDREFPGIPIELFDPDESVAKGAALYGQQLAVNGELINKIAEQTGKKAEDIDISTVSEADLNKAALSVASATGLSLGSVTKSAKTEIVNVVSKSFGIKVIDKNGNYLISNIILKQTSIPDAVKTEEYGTNEANQDSVAIEVFENEFAEKNVQVDQAKGIGEGIIEGLPPNLPAGSPIQVTFKINENGILDVEAIEKTSNKVLNFQIQTANVMSQEEIEAAKKKSTGLKVS